MQTSTTSLHSPVRDHHVAALHRLVVAHMCLTKATHYVAWTYNLPPATLRSAYQVAYPTEMRRL